MSTTRWNVAVSTETDRALRLFLAGQGRGLNGDLSRFIEEAVRAHILEYGQIDKGAALKPQRAP